MNIIKLGPSVTGSRPSIQEDWKYPVPEGYIEVPEGVDTSAMQTHMGFVDLTIDENGVLTEITGNDAAYQAYLANLPPETPPQPTAEERLSALESAMLSMMGVSTDV